MISQVIHDINVELKKLFEKVPGVKVYGLAQTMMRKIGTQTELIPALVDNKGEGTYVGIDDKHPVILYHKTNSINTTIENNGRGDSSGSLKNTYRQSIIIYLNRKKLNLLPDELYMHIQAVFPERFIHENVQVSVRFDSVNLSSTQVWAAEYQREFTLPPEANLFAVNYIVETTFKKKCFDKCINC